MCSKNHNSADILATDLVLVSFEIFWKKKRRLIMRCEMFLIYVLLFMFKEIVYLAVIIYFRVRD